MPRTQPIALRGAPGSPYTRKMLAVLRFRRIAYRFLVGLWAKDKGMPSPKVDLLPTFYFDADDGLEAVVDSTPIIRRLEGEVLGRSVIPNDPVLADRRRHSGVGSASVSLPGQVPAVGADGIRSSRLRRSGRGRRTACRHRLRSLVPTVARHGF